MILNNPSTRVPQYDIPVQWNDVGKISINRKILYGIFVSYLPKLIDDLTSLQINIVNNMVPNLPNISQHHQTNIWMLLSSIYLLCTWNVGTDHKEMTVMNNENLFISQVSRNLSSIKVRFTSIQISITWSLQNLTHVLVCMRFRSILLTTNRTTAKRS